MTIMIFFSPFFLQILDVVLSYSVMPMRIIQDESSMGLTRHFRGGTRQIFDLNWRETGSSLKND